MTRPDQLTYCSVCTNKRTTAIDGIICGLTNTPADFTDSCPDFKLDQEEKKRVRGKYEAEINDSLEKQRTPLKKMVNSEPALKYLVDPAKISEVPSTATSAEVIVSQVRKKKLHMLILGLLLIGFLIKEVLEGRMDFSKPGLVIVFALVGMIASFLVYYSLKSGEILRAGKLGIIISKKEFVPWNQVEYIHMKTIQRDSSTTHLLVLRMHWGCGDDREVEVTYADKDLSELGALMYNFIKTYKIN